jgi:hypothetical protein
MLLVRWLVLPHVFYTVIFSIAMVLAVPRVFKTFQRIRTSVDL